MIVSVNYQALEKENEGGETKTTDIIDPSDDMCGPWKCKKCNIAFTDKEEMFKHWFDTAARLPPDHKGVWFHVIVDRDGDDIAYRKPIH